ncbi:MAG: hypothetical protein JF595_06930 [Sphingomonadales bacterium]|nr:hypothetical protein [Sphingomonadales bacterium]
MPFFVFKLVFAAIALALLVVAGLIARNFWRKRQPQAPATDGGAEPKPAKLGKLAMPGLSKRTPEPEPEAPAPPRRRQLHSFAEAEKSAAEAEAMPLPQPDNEPEGEPEAEFAAEPEAAETPAAPEADYGQAVLDRLEQAFEALQAREITLEAYRTRVLAEQSAVEARVAVLQADVESDELDAALAARESVRWCLDWADEQAGPQEG